MAPRVCDKCGEWISPHRVLDHRCKPELLREMRLRKEGEMGNNLKSWQKYVSQLGKKEVDSASCYLIGALCHEVSQQQFRECLKVVAELLREEKEKC